MPLPANITMTKSADEKNKRKITIAFDVELAQRNTREGFQKEQTKVPNGRVYVLG